MKQKWRSALVSVLLTAIFIVCISLFVDGVPLVHLPKPEAIDHVTVEHFALNTKKEVTDSESIVLAGKLLNFLKIQPFSKAQSDWEPKIQLSFYLKDGRIFTFTASETEVLWNNRLYRLKKKDLFLNLTEGIFFYEDLIRQEAS